MSEEEIHEASEEKPLLTGYEPDFRRVYARGSLVRFDEDDPDVLQLGFWSSKDTDIEMEDGTLATGYRLEVETVLTWRAARRLHDLLGQYIEKYAPRQEGDDAEG